MAKKQIILALIGLIILTIFMVSPVNAASTLKCTVLPSGVCDQAGAQELGKSGIWALLILALNIMTTVVGLVAVAALVFAGFLYITAADKADQVKKAKDMMGNTIIGLILYGLMFALLQWLIPGGLFK